MRRFVMLVALAVASASLTGCGGSMGPASSAAEGGDHPLLGAKSPDFELAAQSGGDHVSLGSEAGKVVIVDFWATWCDPCKESFPHYQAMVDKFGGKLAVIGISVDDEPDGIKDFAKQTGAKFPLAWDEGQALSRQYEPSTMPTSFIIDKSGVVRFVHSGFHSGEEKEIEQQVESLL